VTWFTDLCLSKREIVGEIQNQYKRAFISIPLNIAEGTGKQSGEQQIAEIVAMLTSLAKSVAGDRVNEETVSYFT
jgi:four helix bundle protein